MYRLLAVSLMVLGLVADASADIMTPAGLNPGDQFRIVFVTDGTTPATDPTFTTYDTLVNSEAAAAGLSTFHGSAVTWEAIVSVASGGTAISRLPADGVPLYLNDGTHEVAAGGAELWNTSLASLLHPIDADAAGAPHINRLVWTGTLPSGGAAIPLGQTDPRVQETNGVLANADHTWADFGTTTSTVPSTLYGFSSVLTVPQPAAAVPEPSTLTLVLVGLGSLAGARLARRRREAGAPRERSPRAHS